MGFWTLLVLAVGLSFDSFAASVSVGTCSVDAKRWKRIRFALILAFFQGLMPLLGWIIGEGVHGMISQVDHWIAFGLLFVLGLKMIFDAFESDPVKCNDPLRLGKNLLMGLATSIDALATGMALAMIRIRLVEEASQWMNILLAVGVIFLVTFVFSALGLYTGKKSGVRFGNRAQIAGGIILILIGAKILFEHLSA